MKSSLFRGLSITALFAFAAVIYLNWRINDIVQQPLKVSVQTELTIPKGQSLHGLLRRLERKNWFTHSLAAKTYVRLHPGYTQIKSGTYDVLVGDSLLDLLTRLSSGLEKQFAINLIEGQNWREWSTVIQQHAALQQDLDVQDLSNLTLSLAGQQHANIEGLLLPDTYFFARNSAVSDLLRRANQALADFMQANWPSRALDLPYDSQYEALILASIVEKETGLATERAHIAGVFVNRLRLNMRLQTDPTVIYGMGERFDGNIRRADLREKTPYNTYVIKGLPPTPIAMPSKNAILAVLNPLATEDLYFVSRGDGSHKFSRTLAEHNAAVRKYQLKK